MVSKSNVIITNSVCSCGYGDSQNNQKNYFENKCPACGKEGTLQVETINNVEVDNQSSDDNHSVDENAPVSNKIVCKNCGSEYCGQDGFDLAGGSRASLSVVNPNEITNDEEEVSEEEEEDSSYMSGWEGLCDLLKPLDGLAMMVQRGDFVIVKKIEMPQSAKLWAYEGINIVDDSVTITDYTPEIYNTFVIKWGESFENELEFVFNKHKALFGERKIVMEAKKVQPISDDEEEESDEDKSWSITDLIFGSSNDDKKNNDKTTTDVDSLTTGEDEEDNTEEVPITDREEAIQFGLTQVGKAKRDDGHTIELKVIGNQAWQVGEWCHVKLPSFSEDNYMFISKCSFESSGDSEYINSLTLVDYPPSLGRPNKNKQEENTEEDSEENQNNEDESNTENTDASNSNNDSSSSSSSNSGSS